MTRRWLSSADVEIDDASGALLVKIGDVDLKVDMAQTDVEAIVTGIAGGTPKTLADVVAAVQAADAGSALRRSSGTTAVSTSSDSAVEVIAADPANTYGHLRIVNEGTVAGFYSTNGGTTWSRLPAGTVIRNDGVKIANQAIQIKRVAGGSNLTGVYAEMW